MFVDIITENMQSTLDTDVQNTSSTAFVILEETYRVKHLKTTQRIQDRYTGQYVNSVTDKEAGRYTYETIAKVESLKIKNGGYYYKNSDSASLLYSLETPEGGSPATIPETFQIPSFFDTITITYPKKKALKIGSIEVKTDVLYKKYRVAHHLLEKLFFIGFEEEDDTFGMLYAADLPADSMASVTAEQIHKGGKSNQKAKFIDVVVDQYTGNILLASDTKIFSLHKLVYAADLCRFAACTDEKSLIDKVK